MKTKRMAEYGNRRAGVKFLIHPWSLDFHRHAMTWHGGLCLGFHDLRLLVDDEDYTMMVKLRGYHKRLMESHGRAIMEIRAAMDSQGD